MKTIDFMKRVLGEAKVDLTKLGFTEVPDEVDDTLVEQYSKNLLTRERAEQDADLNRTMQGRAFKAMNDGWDRDFDAFAEANLDKEIADKIKAEKFTRTKWDLIRQNKPVAGDVNESVKAARKEIEMLNAKLREKETALSAVAEGYESKLTEFQKDYLLTQEMSKVEFGEAYTALRPELQKKFLEGISKKSIILAVENEKLVPRVKQGTELLDYYEANEKVGLDRLIQKELDTFIKKSAGAPNPNQPLPPNVPKQTAPKAGLTLEEMNRLAVQEKFAKLKT